MTALRLACIVAFALVMSCGADEFKNPQRLNCDVCKARGGTCITAKFCLFAADGGKDAGLRDAGSRDAGGADDGGSMPVDAGSEPCTQEGATELCYHGDQSTVIQPPCRAGQRKCENGVWGTCEGEVDPMPEKCNGQDDDCDGKVDEMPELPPSCTVPNAQGACGDGIPVCRAGQLECGQFTFPSSDTCDGVDNDCDGKVDEDTSVSCYDGSSGCTKDASGGYQCQGVCAAGTKSCMNGKYEDTCQGSVTPQPEQCTDVGQPALDENCDGQVDEGCSCQNGVMYPCYTGSPPSSQNNPPCHAGMRTCDNGTLGACSGEQTPVPETCANQGSDDDCNGTPDDVPGLGTSCSDVSAAQGVCKEQAVWQCQGTQKACVDGTPGIEVCDGHGEDEDCDGKIDEGFDLQTDVNNCGACGNKCANGLTCCSGSCVNTSRSNLNCGSCGQSCAGGLTCCGASCVNTKSDGKNCGTCGNSCLLGCSGGACTLL